MDPEPTLLDQQRPSTFASLRLPQYRLFWVGYLVSNIGTWMGWVAQDWLVFSHLTDHSAAAMGVAMAFQIAPIVLLAPWTGALADRFPERHVLLATTSVMLGAAACLAVLVAIGHANVPVVLALAAVQGMAVAVEGPARQALVTDLVPARLITNAVGMASLAFNVGRFIGPALAGLMIAGWGLQWAVAANALSFLALLLSVGLMRVQAAPKGGGVAGLHGMGQAVGQVRRTPLLACALVVACVVAGFGLNLPVVNALMVQREFEQTSLQYGLFGSAIAVGTLGAALITARQGYPRLRVSLLGAAVFSAAAGLAAVAPNPWLFAGCVAIMGCGAVSAILVANSLVRLLAVGRLRGRLMALYLATTQGCYLVGALVLGWLGDLLGPRWLLVLACAGVLVLVAVVAAASRAVDDRQSVLDLREEAVATPCR